MILIVPIVDNSTDVIIIKDEYTEGLKLEPLNYNNTYILKLPNSINNNTKNFLKYLLNMNSKDFLIRKVISEDEHEEKVSYCFIETFDYEPLNLLSFDELIELINFFDCMNIKKLIIPFIYFVSQKFNKENKYVLDIAKNRRWGDILVYYK